VVVELCDQARLQRVCARDGSGVWLSACHEAERAAEASDLVAALRVPASHRAKAFLVGASGGNG
jgi:hypothetical protein